MNNKMENKYLFAHYLRGLAAISVVIAHYGTAFFNSNDVLAPLVNAPQVKDRTYPWIIGFIPQDFPGFLGVFGVTIFFIISGFVIPLSIEKYNIKTFLLKRFFRLYPTYFFIFSLNMLIAFIGYCVFKKNGVEYIYSNYDIFTSYFIGLNTYISGCNWLDPVAWTLAIEITFYIISSLLFNLSFLYKKEKKISSSDIITLSFLNYTICLVLSKYYNELSLLLPYLNIGTVIKSLHLMSFILFGTSFFLFTKKRIKVKSLIALLVGQYFSFLYISMKIVPQGQYIPILLTFSWLAISILAFSICISTSHNFKKNSFAEFMSNISYPLYLCHSYIGYLIISIVIYYDLMPRSLAILIPIPIALLIAYYVHKHIETKSYMIADKILVKINK